MALAAFCFVTGLGIPFGIQRLKLACLALSPIGQTIVPNAVAQATRQQAAEAVVTQARPGR